MWSKATVSGCTAEMRARRLKPFLPRLVALAAGVAFADGFASAQPVREVIVEAPRPERGGGSGELASVRLRVGYADIDLATPAGAAMLEQRIREAARRACRDLEILYPDTAGSRDRPCMKAALDPALAEARAAIAAAGQSH
jgi:UrcA family protein